jgi:hypothetical protein
MRRETFDSGPSSSRPATPHPAIPGFAFAALIANWRPELIDYYSLDPDDPDAILARAFAAAEELGIVCLLEPADLLDDQTDEERIYSQLIMHREVQKTCCVPFLTGVLCQGSGNVGPCCPRAHSVSSPDAAQRAGEAPAAIA